MLRHESSKVPDRDVMEAMSTAELLDLRGRLRESMGTIHDDIARRKEAGTATREWLGKSRAAAIYRERGLTVLNGILEARSYDTSERLARLAVEWADTQTAEAWDAFLDALESFREVTQSEPSTSTGG
jgi:hypothetical protein